MRLISKSGYGIFIRGNALYFSTGNSFYQYDLATINKVSKSAYLSQKYGTQNKFWHQDFNEFVKLKNGDFITTFYQENEVRLHAPDGKVKRKFEKIHAPDSMGIYGMTIDKNENLWIAVPTEHYVGKFNIDNEEELFSVRGKNLEPTLFNYPENVISIGDYAYVSDMGNRRIVKIHIENHRIEDYKKFAEPIYYFNQLNGQNIYQLGSGIYIE